jgi:hypothetical protein
MRSLALVLPVSLMFVVSVQGQALTEHAAAAAGAAVGTGAGKTLSNAMTKIFGDTDKETAKAAKPDAKKPSKPVTTPAADPLVAKSKPSPMSGGAAADAPLPPLSYHSDAQPRSRAVRKPAPQDETALTLIRSASMPPMTAAIPIAQPIVKVPTVEDLANIKVGTTEEELFTALGQPSSRVSVPDDDGHLRESCQYWANGRQLGTIRLDNGQVVTVETRPEN